MNIIRKRVSGSPVQSICEQWVSADPFSGTHGAIPGPCCIIQATGARPIKQLSLLCGEKQIGYIRVRLLKISIMNAEIFKSGSGDSSSLNRGVVILIIDFVSTESPNTFSYLSEGNKHISFFFRSEKSNQVFGNCFSCAPGFFESLDEQDEIVDLSRIIVV